MDNKQKTDLRKSLQNAAEVGRVKIEARNGDIV